MKKVLLNIFQLNFYFNLNTKKKLNTNNKKKQLSLDAKQYIIWKNIFCVGKQF